MGDLCTKAGERETRQKSGRVGITVTIGLTTRQRIGKTQRALLPKKYFEILQLQRCVFLNSEAADNVFQLPKKDNFSRQYNHDFDTNIHHTVTN